MKNVRHILLLFSASVCLFSCSTDETAEWDGGDGTSRPDGKVNVSLTLATADMGVDIKQRATWQDVHAVDKEMMKTARVVMVNDATGLIESIFAPSIAEESERERITNITTQTGTYTFYNFANLPFVSTNDGNNGFSLQSNGDNYVFKVGSAVPSGLDDAVYTASFNGYDLTTGFANGGIPMSNKEQHEISSDVSLTLQVYRMLSKMEFSFRNNSSMDVVVKKVTMSSFTPNGTHIYLLPPKDDAGLAIAKFPDTYTGETIDLFENTANTAIPVDGTAGTDLIPTYYFNEMKSTHDTQQIPLTVTLQRGDEAEIDARYSLMKINEVARNSYVTIPIIFTDYDLKLEAFFYPPIGGYPIYTLEKHDDEYYSAYYATFEGAGDITFRPKAYEWKDRNDPNKYFDLYDTSKIVKYSIEFGGDTDIFSVLPHIDTSTGEILGTLNGTKKGIVSVQLNITFKVSDTVNQEYARTIYIIAQ